MHKSLNLIMIPIIAILILMFMMAGYKLTQAYKGPSYCMSALEDENPRILDNWAEINSLNTRILDDHWISAIAFRSRGYDEYSDDQVVTFICHFEDDTHTYKWSKRLGGNEIEILKATSSSIVNPQTW